MKSYLLQLGGREEGSYIDTHRVAGAFPFAKRALGLTNLRLRPGELILRGVWYRLGSGRWALGSPDWPLVFAKCGFGVAKSRLG